MKKWKMKKIVMMLINIAKDPTSICEGAAEKSPFERKNFIKQGH